MSSLSISLPTEDHTEQFGLKIAESMNLPLVIYLIGDLGAGKTRLSRAILHGLGHHGTVKSPTYTIVEPYNLDSCDVYHFDLYRLADPLELDFLGIRDYFTENSLALVEWPERGKGVLNPADINIELSFTETGRDCVISSKSSAGEDLITNLKKNL